jgi:mannose-1-phosphate guanylyltransferase/phosphomannomutase
MKAFILAAGQGSRLRQLTARRPKPMLPLRNIPLLQHTIEWLAGHGFDDIVINLHHCPAEIVEYFGDGARFQVSIAYSYEAEPLGTAGGAKRIQHYLDNTFAVVYGDVYSNVDLTRIRLAHARHVAAAGRQHRSNGHGCLTLLTYEVPNPEECGLVELEPNGRVRSFVEKPPMDQIFTNQAFAGVMLCEPQVLDYVPEHRAFDFGHDLIPILLASQVALYGEPLTAREFVIDIGTLNGYFRALKAASAYAADTEYSVNVFPQEVVDYGSPMGSTETAKV